MRLVWIALVPLALVIGCNSSDAPAKKPDATGWDGNVQQWGTLREVMHGQIMDGQVRLAEVTDKPNLVGIGAPDKLQGEILIADSEAWVARIGEGDHIETRQSSPDDSAVFLAIAQVPQWTAVRVEQDVSAEEFDDFIQQAAKDAGLESLNTVPFLIDGQFSSLKLHVLNGQCPFAEVESKIEGSGPPLRLTKNDARGRLVGFYSENGAGRITHHWTRTHVHALLEAEDGRLAGHVDEVALKAGTTLRLPEYHSADGK